MNPTTLVITADLHLDAPFSSTGSPELAHARREDLRQALSSVVELALRENAQALLVCGDLYEHAWASGQTLSFAARQFSRLAPAPVVVIPGNHDPLVAKSWHLRADWPANVHLLTRAEPALELPEAGLRIVGCGFEGESGDAFDPASLPPADPARRSVLMLHGTLDMAFSGERYCPVSSEALAQTGFDLVAMGHFHGWSEKRLFRSDGGELLVVNPGSPEPLGFDEPGEHGAAVVRFGADPALPADRATAEFVPLATRRMHRLEVNLAGVSSAEAIVMAVCAALEGLDPERDLTDLRLTGRCPARPNVFLLHERFADARLQIRIVDETLPDFDYGALRQDPGLKGIFLREMESRAEAARLAGDTALEARIGRAAAFGLEALETGLVPDFADGGGELR